MAKRARGDLLQSRLRELLHYNPATGVLTRRVAASRCKAGGVAGRVNRARGYRYISIDGHAYMAHRLVWLYVHGRWPEAEIDHINGVRDDNRLANLRDVSVQANRRNSKSHRDSTSAFKGVSFDSARQKWAARIYAGKRTVNIGRFDSEEAAARAYDAAARQHFGAFAKLNFAPVTG